MLSLNPSFHPAILPTDPSYHFAFFTPSPILDPQPACIRYLTAVRQSVSPVATPIRQRDIRGGDDQLQEELLFQINYRTDITTVHIIRYNGVLYDITRIDNYEGRKEDLKLYCMFFHCIMGICLL